MIYWFSIIQYIHYLQYVFLGTKNTRGAEHVWLFVILSAGECKIKLLFSFRAFLKHILSGERRVWANLPFLVMALYCDKAYIVLAKNSVFVSANDCSAKIKKKVRFLLTPIFLCLFRITFTNYWFSVYLKIKYEMLRSVLKHI